jgi:purine nucleosidase
MNPRLIIDTDIGSDVDDALALAYAITAGIDIALITTVHGPTEVRASIAKKLTALFGMDIPVVAGERMPIKQKQLFTTGLEGRGFLAPGEHYPVPSDAPRSIAETVRANPGSIDIAAIGPLTNIARAFERYPDIIPLVRHLYVMGNAIVLPDAYHLNYRAHNFKVDPEAADVALSAGVPTTIVTTDICKRSALTRADLDSLASLHPAYRCIRDAAIPWLAFINYDVAYLYDPLVVHHHLDPGYTQGKTYKSTTVSTDVKPGFGDLLLRTLRDGLRSVR